MPFFEREWRGPVLGSLRVAASAAMPQPDNPDNLSHEDGSMRKTTSIIVLTTGLALGLAAAGKAQTTESKGYIDVNLGGQTQARSFSTTTTFPLYDETATVQTSQKVGSGRMFDLGGGYKVWNNLAVGVAFSVFKSEDDGTVTATIPNPLVFDQFVTVNGAAQRLKHSEIGTHIKVVYFVPITSKLDVAVSAGPSFVRVNQDMVTADVVTGTQNINVTSTNQKATAKGANVGVDANFMFTDRWGAGFFMRYVSGSVDLPGVSGLKVGGFQVGGGARLRF
jgi:hypothetical protein